MKKSDQKALEGLSISTKIDLVLIVLFIIILTASSLYQFQSQRSLVEHLVEDQASTLAGAYFDNVNTLMLTGGMANKQIARKKLTSRDDVIDARIIRGEAVRKTFGPGDESNQSKDEWDRQGLRGTSISEFRSGDDGRILTVVVPMPAQKDARGTNCLLCHAVPEGEILGAVRLDFSLNALDSRIFKELWINIGLNTFLLIGGLAIISYLLKKLVVNRLRAVRRTVDDIASTSDLTLRVQVSSKDELHSLALSINHMMEKFSAIINQVSESTLQLGDESQSLTRVTDQSIDGIRMQEQESGQAASAMVQMEQAAGDAANSASGASEAARQADQLALEGADVVSSAISSINNLAEKITQASGVITQLEEDSDGIGNVVEVITNIADQTNLLALNAAIEAARAGEQGRGFAVVADEVRTLATRTHDATQEIQGMIEGLQKQAQSAATMMNQSQEGVNSSVTEAARAGESLTAITDSIKTINTMNEQIATSANQQSVVAGEIRHNIEAINEVTGQTTQHTEQIAQTSHRLSDLSAKLKEMMDRFKV